MGSIPLGANNFFGKRNKCFTCVSKLWKNFPPRPGIEPGPSTWQAEILTTRLSRICWERCSSKEVWRQLSVKFTMKYLSFFDQNVLPLWSKWTKNIFQTFSSIRNMKLTVLQNQHHSCQNSRVLCPRLSPLSAAGTGSGRRGMTLTHWH